ncbi:TetR/AcrR family transcriptional regulator [Kineococcus terrestris]|uniref:TetR/AcrR family transcriptional regulator n=1 Tax=Kineococcus terrestris TaxID=2044856 RepID=UPI0034DB58F6
MSDPPDRRAAAKARHRAAILAAAKDLLEERGPAGLSADDLAARADVARRTLFNHFSSLEEVVVACLEAELHAAIASVEAVVRTTAPAGDPLDDLEASLRGADLLAVVVRFARMTTGPDGADHQERLQQRAMRHVADPVARQLRERHPELGDLDAVLLTTTVLNGLSVLAAAWLRETGGGRGLAARRRWDELLDHLFTSLRRGFAAPQRTARTTSPSTEGA